MHVRQRVGNSDFGHRTIMALRSSTGSVRDMTGVLYRTSLSSDERAVREGPYDTEVASSRRGLSYLAFNKRLAFSQHRECSISEDLS